MGVSGCPLAPAGNLTSLPGFFFCGGLERKSPLVAAAVCRPPFKSRRPWDHRKRRWSARARIASARCRCSQILPDLRFRTDSGDSKYYSQEIQLRLRRWEPDDTIPPMSKKRPGPGRPPKDEASLKNVPLTVLVTQRQKDRYEAAAEREQFDSLASWVRDALDARAAATTSAE